MSQSAAPTSNAIPPRIAGPGPLPVKGSDDAETAAVVEVVPADAVVGVVAASVTTVDVGVVVFTTEVGDTVIVVAGPPVVVVVASSVVVVVASSVVVVVGASVEVVVASSVVVVVGASVVVVVASWHCDRSLTVVVFVAVTPSEGQRASTVSVTVPVVGPGMVVVAVVEPDGPTLTEYPVTA